MAINYKNVVSIQSNISGAGGSGSSGFTYAGRTADNIIKHRGFILVPTAGVTAAMAVLPTYYGADGLTLAGATLSVGGNGANSSNISTQPVEVSLRMKNFTGLTGGAILFVV